MKIPMIPAIVEKRWTAAPKAREFNQNVKDARNELSASSSNLYWKSFVYSYTRIGSTPWIVDVKKLNTGERFRKSVCFAFTMLSFDT